MNDFFANSYFMGIFLTLALFQLGRIVHKFLPWPIFHPMLVGMAILVAILATTDLTTEAYFASSRYLMLFMTPTTVCLAVPLYQEIQQLRRHWRGVAAGIITGVFLNLAGVYVFARLLGFDHAVYVSFIPKSVTTAIGMGLTAEMGGHVSITMVLICINGMFGNLCGPWVCKLCGIREPVAKGVAMGTASHAFGTIKALDLGRVEGAMSGLSIALTGILTVAGAAFVSSLI